MSEKLPVGLYKGISTSTGEYAPLYNKGGEYGWLEYGQYCHWQDGAPKWSTGWFKPAIVRWADLISCNELEFLVMTGREFRVPDV